MGILIVVVIVVIRTVAIYHLHSLLDTTAVALRRAAWKDGQRLLELNERAKPGRAHYNCRTLKKVYGGYITRLFFLSPETNETRQYQHVCAPL